MRWTGEVCTSLGTFGLWLSVGLVASFVSGLARVPWWMVVLSAPLASVGSFLVTAGNRIATDARRYLATVIATPQEIGDEPFTLYLRSFADDQRLAEPPRLTPTKEALREWFMGSRTEEEHLTAALTERGLEPIVAVGQPGEELPHVGAMRMYLPRDDWQEPVRELMRRARLVVIVLGRGAGTMWELVEAMSILPPQRLLLVVPMPPADYERFRKVAAAKLRARRPGAGRAGHRSTPRLPDDAGAQELPSSIRGLIHFSADWEPTFVRLRFRPRDLGSLRKSVRHAVKPALAQLHAYEQAQSAGDAARRRP